MSQFTREKSEPTRFVPLKTKGGDAARGFPDGDGPVVREVESYLAHVAGARGGKPLCPFTRAVYATDGFTLRLIKEPPAVIDLDAAGGELGRELERLSPGRVGKGLPTDLKVVIGAFTDPDCRTPEFAERMQTTHKRLKPAFLARGQMFSAMFETHPDPSGNRGFNSSVPLFVARRMHERDRAFMNTPDAERIFSSFFGPAD